MNFWTALLVLCILLVLIYYSKRICTRLTVVREWKDNVNPHGDLEQILPGIYRVQSTYHGKLWNMYVYPLLRGGLLIVNPMIVRKDVLDKILKLGEPSVLVCLADTIDPVPTKDVFAWRKKFPDCIFTCPHTSYYRLVRDIPLTYLRDLTVEIQIHYDDVEIIFPTEDKKELHMLLRVKDDYSDSLTPNEVLVTGEMLVGPTTPDGGVAESTWNKLWSSLARNRDTTARVFHRVAREHVITGILPVHGLPLLDTAACPTTRPKKGDSSSSSSSSDDMFEEKPVDDRQKASKVHVAFKTLADTFGPEKPADPKKQD